MRSEQKTEWILKDVYKKVGFETRPEDFQISLKKKGQRITNLGGRELQTLGLEKKQLGNWFMKKD